MLLLQTHMHLCMLSKIELDGECGPCLYGQISGHSWKNVNKQL